MKLRLVRMTRVLVLPVAMIGVRRRVSGRMGMQVHSARVCTLRRFAQHGGRHRASDRQQNREQEQKKDAKESHE